MAIEQHFESHPDGSTLILKHDLNTPLSVLDTVSDDEEPLAAIVFFAFWVMVAIWLGMLTVGI